MILELRNIEKSFGEKKVLTGVSFKAEGGKAFGLLGRNGAGKTTSIRILMDVFPANSGEVLIDGKPIDYSKVGIGYLPEGFTATGGTAEKHLGFRGIHKPLLLFCNFK